MHWYFAHCELCAWKAAIKLRTTGKVFPWEAQIVSKAMTDVLDKSGVEQRREEGMEDNTQEESFAMVGERYLVESLALAYQAADEESEMLSLY